MMLQIPHCPCNMDPVPQVPKGIPKFSHLAWTPDPPFFNISKSFQRITYSQATRPYFQGPRPLSCGAGVRGPVGARVLGTLADGRLSDWKIAIPGHYAGIPFIRPPISIPNVLPNRTYPPCPSHRTLAFSNNQRRHVLNDKGCPWIQCSNNPPFRPNNPPPSYSANQLATNRPTPSGNSLLGPHCVQVSQCFRPVS